MMDSHRVNSQVEVVVTLPDSLETELTSRLTMRSTLGVLTELLASAEEYVVIAAPFMQGVEGLHAGPLGRALVAAVKRGIRLDVVSTGASLSSLNLKQLREIPGARVRAFRPRENVEDPRMLGSHAKVVVRDGADAYVGSANITQRGIGGHLEMGVLLHGEPAREVSALIRVLLDSDYLVEDLS